jgi:hypothetical protein
MTSVSTRCRRAALASLAALALAACTSVPREGADIAASPWALQSGQTQAPHTAWTHLPFPGKRPTEFRPARVDGRDTVAARAEASASMLRQKLRVEPQHLGGLQFSWRVPALIAGADLALRDKDDAPVRVVLAFDGDRRRLSQRDAALSELARAITGEDMPYATLMYVWSGTRAAGTVLASPRTDRIRRLVVESGAARLDRWLDYERDIRADYEHAFGEPPGALVGIAVMTDSDNTGARTQAWYGPVRLLPTLAKR